MTVRCGMSTSDTFNHNIRRVVTSLNERLKIVCRWLMVPSMAVVVAGGLVPAYAHDNQIIITMDAGGYTPVVPTKDNPHPSTEMTVLAKQYEKLHPNVTIQFIPSASTATYNTAGGLLAKAQSGSAPDIIWAQENQVNSGGYPSGLFVDLRPYLQEPNPYIPGNKHWIDVFNPTVIQEVTNANGAIYVDSAEYIAAAIVYNKAAFNKAHITVPPTTFAELTVDEQKLAKAGFMPFGFTLAAGDLNLETSWWERYAQSSFFQSDLSKFNVNHAQYETSGLDYAVAVKKGIFSMKNPRYAEIWKLLKQWSKYWEPNPVDYSDFPPTGVNAGATWLLTPFMQGKLAMAFEGTWAVQQLNNLGFNGKFGVMAFPNFTKETTPFAGKQSISYVVSGPTGNWQFYIPTQQADHSMTGAKLKATVDWLMYISTPQRSAQVINQVGTSVPTMKGAKPLLPSLRSVIPPTGAQQPVIVDGVLDGILTSTAVTQSEKLLAAYLTNQLSWSDFAQQWDSMLQQQADAWAQQNKVDLSKYTS